MLKFGDCVNVVLRSICGYLDVLIVFMAVPLPALIPCQQGSLQSVYCCSVMRSKMY